MINLARGHALLYGRNYITLEDVPITIKTALSTAQIGRVSLFDLLLAHNGTLNTTQMEDYLSFSPPTIRRIMTEFKATRLVKVEAVGSSHQQSMYLKDEFKWFLADEFKKLREGFIPTDYHEFMKEPKKEKSPPYSTPNYSSAYERIEVFCEKFDQLPEVVKPFAMQSDEGTVGRFELQEALVSSGKFHQNDAVIIIDEMISMHKISIVAVNTYRKNQEDND